MKKTNILITGGAGNIGSSDEIQIAELAKIIKKLLKSKSLIKNINPLKEGDMSRRYPDNKKMLQIINRDLISLEKGIKKTAAHKKNLKVS